VNGLVNEQEGEDVEEPGDCDTEWADKRERGELRRRDVGIIKMWRENHSSVCTQYEVQSEHKNRDHSKLP
jgi:hypothetical protein